VTRRQTMEQRGRPVTVPGVTVPKLSLWGQRSSCLSALLVFFLSRYPYENTRSHRKWDNRGGAGQGLKILWG